MEEDFMQASEIIALQKKIDNLVADNLDLLDQEHLVEIDDKIIGANVTWAFFANNKNKERIRYELTSLLDWLTLYIRGVVEF